jgi:hypothetical protein
LSPCTSTATRYRRTARAIRRVLGSRRPIRAPHAKERGEGGSERRSITQACLVTDHRDLAIADLPGEEFECTRRRFGTLIAHATCTIGPRLGGGGAVQALALAELLG